MHRTTSSLGLKLNLALIILLLLLGGATVFIILHGFAETQDNATTRSREGLEDLGRSKIQFQVTAQGQLGVQQMQWASDSGHVAANYLSDLSRLGGSVPFDTSRLSRTPEGVLHDPSTSRHSDVVLPSFAPLTAEAINDIQQSAALDAVFRAFLSPYGGRVRDAGFDGIAVYYSSVNHVTRYYPPVGLHLLANANADLSARLNQLGPENNQERRTIWSAPYQDSAGQGLVMTAFTPVYFGDTYRGIVGVDFSVGKLVEVVNQVQNQTTPSAFAFYVDRDGKLLVSKSYTLINDALAGPDGDALAATMDAMRRGESNVARISLNGRETFVAYSPLQSVGGSFAIAAPVDELTQQAAAITASIEDEGNRTLLLTLAGMGILFILALATASWLNRRVLLRPIEALVAGTQAVAAGDLDTTLPLAGDDELTALARSFNAMTAEMRQRREALEQEVIERRQAQDELRALFAAMTDYVVVMNGEGRYLRVQSTNTPELLGPPEDLVGRTMAEVMSEEQAAAFLQPIREALVFQETRTVEYPLEVDGQTRWFSSSISPISTENVVIVARDITERVLARQELERRVEERTRELQTLLEVSKNVASTLELRPLLRLIIDQLKSVADYDRASIFTVEGDELVLLDSRQDTGTSAPISLRIPLSLVPNMWQQILRGDPYIIENVRDDSAGADGFRAATGELYDTAFKDIHSWMGVPLALKDRLLGLLTVSHTQVAFYNAHHAQLVGAIASQAAVAIENARLYGQAQQLAAVEERQRLARELHDSVSQALYGIALGAKTARTLLDRDPVRATEPVDYVLSLAEAGLTEMRALIFELRPESLEIEGLVGALDKQIAAMAARYGIAFEADLGEEPALPLSDKEVFYRVSQEALHNMVKHSHATQASVRLNALNGDICLEVRDNGVGFETGQSFPGHMGLVSMAERAASIGAELEVESAPGMGTTVRMSRHE